MKLPTPAVAPRDRAGWRAWLAAHHRRSTGVWLVFRKKLAGQQTLALSDAVEEALCFGWIDSKLRRVDAERSALRFTPRRPKSAWAPSNKRRVGSLIARGLMRPAGIRAVERAKRDGSWTALDAVEGLRVPRDLATALAAEPGGKRRFAALAPSAQKARLWWIESAKRPKTRARRIAETVRLAAPPEDLFARHPGALAIYRKVYATLEAVGVFQVRTTKSYVAFRRRIAFGWLWLPGRWLRNPASETVLSVALTRRIRSRRFKQVVRPTPERWMHHMEVRSARDIDEEVLGWLAEAYEDAE